MAVREYIGARYVPIFADPVEWDIDNSYEALMMVQHLGETFITRQAVPPGIQLPNTAEDEESNEYWVHMSNWNAQVESYRQEVLTFDGRISSIEGALPIADFDSTNTVDKAIDDLGNSLTSTQSDVTDIENALPIADFDSVNTVGKAIDDLENEIAIEKTMHKSVVKTFASARAYLNSVTGDDSTAEIGDDTKPFKTIEAAINEQLRRGSFIDVTFQTIGNHYLPYSVYAGCVIHFRIEDENMSGAVNIYPPENHTGGLYFYDTHINLISTQNAYIVLNCNSIIEIEGSAVTNAVRATINCTDLHIVQSSMSFNNVTLNGRLTGYFAKFRVNTSGLTIHDTSVNNAVSLICSSMRIDGNGLIIYDNLADVSAKAAFYALSSDIYWNPGSDPYAGPSLSYQRMMELRGCTVRMSLDFLNSLDSKCANASTLASFTVRIQTTGVLFPSA